MAWRRAVGDESRTRAAARRAGPATGRLGTALFLVSIVNVSPSVFGEPKDRKFALHEHPSLLARRDERSRPARLDLEPYSVPGVTVEVEVQRVSGWRSPRIVLGALEANEVVFRLQAR